MKELKKLFIVNILTFWILYILINWLFSLLSIPIDYFNILVVGLIISVLFASINYLIVRSLLRPKLDFLNSTDTQSPPFGNKIEKSFQIERNDFSFEVIKYKIAEHYKVVLYEDVEKNIIKFHTGLSISSWGVGGAVFYDAPTKMLTLTCFPLSGYTEKATKMTESVMNKIESLITR